MYVCMDACMYVCMVVYILYIHMCIYRYIYVYRCPPMVYVYGLMPRSPNHGPFRYNCNFQTYARKVLLSSYVHLRKCKNSELLHGDCIRSKEGSLILR